MKATAFLAVLLVAGIVALTSLTLERRAARAARQIARFRESAALSWHAISSRDLGFPSFEADHLLSRGSLALERLELTAAQSDFRRIIELGAWTPADADLQVRVEEAWEGLRRVDAMLEDR